MQKTRARDAENAHPTRQVPSHHQDFGKINVSAANADKRHFARLLDQKPLHLSRWFTCPGRAPPRQSRIRTLSEKPAAMGERMKRDISRGKQS